ncbi:MAG: glycine--tRNA ligase [Candidatus Pacearchaeota archaeon]
MAFIVKKKINDNEYYYLNENKRVNGKVKTKTLAYLGKTKKEAEEKMNEFLEKMKDKEEEKITEVKIEKSSMTIEELAQFCKSKGFVFRSNDIYGGVAGFWDFGPLGIELFNNLKNHWWKFFVHKKNNVVGMEGSIIGPEKLWKASGHVEGFKDVAVVCKKCKKSTKLDMGEFGKVSCDNCGGEYEKIGEFNMLFKTSVGALKSEDAYLRGETAQGMFTDFKLINQTSRMKLPFGVAQIGRCFRNEIAPRDFLFRCREFHIAELEFFINPEEKKSNLLEEENLDLEFNFLDSKTQRKNKTDLIKTNIRGLLKDNLIEEWHAYWLSEQIRWLKDIGLEEIKIREHTKEELSHYSSGTFDIDYSFPFGSKEITGIANRQQFDLIQHQNASKENLEIYDEGSGKKILPKVIEPTFGLERIFLALIINSYMKNEKGEVILKIPKKLAPFKAAIFPLVKKPEFEKLSKEIFENLSENFNVSYDNSGSIGRRYARNDEIGTPYCITVDGDSQKNKDVTIRDRDTTKQVRVKIFELSNVLSNLIDGKIEFNSLQK